MEYKTISLQEFQEILRLIKGSKIIGLTTITEPRLKKGSPANIVKITRLNCIINCDYSSCVNNERVREDKAPDFIPNIRAWGDRLTNSPFVSYVRKDGAHELYLEVKIQRVISVEYRQYGKTIPFEQVKNFLYEKKSSADHQGVSKEIIWRDYNVKNIVSIDLDGCGYIIKN